MQARRLEPGQTPGLFRSKLKSIINLDHELSQLSELINWNERDQEFGKFFPSPCGNEAAPTGSRKANEGSEEASEKIEDVLRLCLSRYSAPTSRSPWAGNLCFKNHEMRREK